MSIQVGSLVNLNAKEYTERFGKGPFRVTQVIPHIHAVEIDEVGTVDLRDVSLVSDTEVSFEEASSLTRQPVQLPPIDTSSTETVDDEDEDNEDVLKKLPAFDVQRKIEGIAGKLLSHRDSSVYAAGKEILLALWRE